MTTDALSTEIVSWVLVGSDGKYVDGMRHWLRDPTRAWCFRTRQAAEIHASTYGEDAGIKIRRRTLRVVPKRSKT